MWGFTFAQYLVGIFFSFLFGVVACFFYYLFLLFFETVKRTVVGLKRIKKQKSKGFKSLFIALTNNKSAISGVGRHIYDFFFVFLSSVLFLFLNFILFDGVIRFIAVFFLFLGFLISKPIFKKLSGFVGKIISPLLSSPLVLFCCIKRHFFEKNNKLSSKTE